MSVPPERVGWARRVSSHPVARAWLAKKGYDPVYGARPLARVVQKFVRDPLTDELLFGQLEHGGTVTIGAGGDALTFHYEGREADATAVKSTPYV